MLPFPIHSDTMTNRFSDVVTPNSGSMFGWRSALHPTTSLQNFCETWSAVDTHNKSKRIYLGNLLEIAREVHPQNLGRNLLAAVSTLPHVPEFIMAERVPHWVIAKRDF